MNKDNWKTYALWIGIALGVGGLSGWLTREGSRIFNETAAQPPLSPPAWVFPVVWEGCTPSWASAPPGSA